MVEDRGCTNLDDKKKIHLQSCYIKMVEDIEPNGRERIIQDVSISKVAEDTALGSQRRINKDVNVVSITKVKDRL